jgi:hypothetical protein
MTAPVIDLHAIRQQLGGQVFGGGRRWSGPGPGHSRRDRSLSVWVTDDDRLLIYSFAGDDYRACADHLGLPAGRPASASRSDRERLKAERRAEEARRDAAAQCFCDRLWSGVEPIADSLVETYLAARWIASTPADVAFHPACPRGYHSAATVPAMLALVRSVTGAPKAVQATFLGPDGRSHRGRVTFGKLAGGAVRLAEAGAELAIAEGLETAAAFATLYGMPCWSACGTANLEAFNRPSGVRRLTIAADGDAAGMNAAMALASSLRARCDVVIRPAPEGMDWNDVLRRARHG